MRRRLLAGLAIPTLILTIGACSSSGSSKSSTTASTSPTATAGPTPAPPTTASPSTAAATPTATKAATITTTTAPAPSAAVPATASPTSVAGPDPNAPEVVEPGDIPDNQVFVAYASPDGLWSVKVPEGWARTTTGDAVVFTDHYNSVTVQSSQSTSDPTLSAAKTSGLADVASDSTFHLVDVQPVTRRAGTGTLATYEIGSEPNAVTGKKALLAVERYTFAHNGTAVVLTLSGAKGADNVDPWKIVSDSLQWTS